MRVVASRSQQAGLAAAVALTRDADADANAGAMREALAARAHRRASRPPRARTPPGRFAVGDAVGFVDDELVAWGETGADAARRCSRALAADAELVTCIAGEGAPLDGEAIAALAPGRVELELEDGGQPSYWWLLARRVGGGRRRRPRRCCACRTARPGAAAAAGRARRGGTWHSARARLWVLVPPRTKADVASAVECSLPGELLNLTFT